MDISDNVSNFISETQNSRMCTAYARKDYLSVCFPIFYLKWNLKNFFTRMSITFWKFIGKYRQIHMKSMSTIGLSYL